MASVESLDNIKARLDAFIKDIHSLTTRSPANHKGTLIILYGQTHLDIPQHHIKLREIEAGREAPEFMKCEVLLRGALHDCVLFRTTIHNSSLKNCTAIACTIYGGKIETSQLKDCRIGKKALGIYDTSLPAPFISCCHIENGAVYDAEIFNSTLNGVSPMQNCDIDSSLAIHSFGLDSTLSSCGVHESKLHNCKAVAGVLTESVFESKYFLTLRTFPVEIRRAIYSNVIANDGLTTSLIAALRPDSLLYGEILETLFQEHAFLLSGENQEVFKSASKTILQRITKIDLK